MEKEKYNYFLTVFYIFHKNDIKIFLKSSINIIPKGICQLGP